MQAQTDLRAGGRSYRCGGSRGCGATFLSYNNAFNHWFSHNDVYVKIIVIDD